MLASGTFGGLVVSMLASGTFGGLVVSMLASGTFGGLVVSMLPSGTQVRGFKPPSDLLRRKNAQHAFLRKGSKAVCPMSQIFGVLKNPVITWKLITGKICRPFLDRFLPSLTEVSDACVAWSASGVDGRN
jgi:hypothetical protein